MEKLRALIKGVSERRTLLKLHPKDRFTMDMLLEDLDDYIHYCRRIETRNRKLGVIHERDTVISKCKSLTSKGKKCRNNSYDSEYCHTHGGNKKPKPTKKGGIRRPNFPSEVSENIVKFVISVTRKITPNWMCESGDLECRGKKLEVKAFPSIGPTSFGAGEKWWRLYFLDCRDYMKGRNGKYICYEILMTSDEWKDIKVSKTESFRSQADKKRRPRHSPLELLKQVPEDRKRILFSDSLEVLVNRVKELRV